MEAIWTMLISAEQARHQLCADGFGHPCNGALQLECCQRFTGENNNECNTQCCDWIFTQSAQ